jgi:hypothetical protein
MPVPNITIAAPYFSFDSYLYGYVTGMPFYRDTASDVTIRKSGYDLAGNYWEYPFVFEPEISFYILQMVIPISVFEFGAELSGPSLVGTVVTAAALEYGAEIVFLGATIGPTPLHPLVRIGKIGEMYFVKDETGEVIDRIMSWPGWIYQIRKLGNSGVIIYGQNGVTRMYPVDVKFGVQDLLLVGLMGRGAVCSKENEREHYFIDKTGLFWKLTEGGEPKSIDYSNHFSTLNSNVLMHYDNRQDMIYICDGVLGFVWSEWGLGQGPNNITGLGTKDGIDYVISPGTITTDPFQITTDIMDGETKRPKTVTQMELGISAVKDVYAALDYRWNKGGAWITSPWVKADRAGTVNNFVSGVEFRAKVKMTEWEDVKLDYIRVEMKS